MLADILLYHKRARLSTVKILKSVFAKIRLDNAGGMCYDY